MTTLARFGPRAALLLLTAGWICSGAADEVADAEQAELAKQAAFRTAMASIVEDLNGSWYGSFIDAIDRDDMVERIFGLRLIDAKVKKQFLDNLEYRWQPMIESAFTETEDGLKARLLGVESHGNEGRAVVRFDLPDFQFNYHEYLLRLDSRGRVVIVDWIDFLDGMLFTENVGRQLVMSLPSKPAMRKLLDFQNASDAELFQFGEMLKSARDGRLSRYLQTRDSLEQRFRGQRIVIETTVQLCKRVRNRREMVGALKLMAEQYPDEPLYSLMLLDYYFPSRKYTEAFAALQRLHDRLAVDDAAMEARLSAAALVLGKAQDANAHAERALDLQSDLELAWWSALKARAALADFAGSVKALQVLENQYRYELGPDALQRDPAYRDLVASAEYQDWLKSRQ
jgi:hypothetical protein